MNTRHIPRIVAGLVSILMMIFGALIGASLLGAHFGFGFEYSLIVLGLASTLFHLYSGVAQYFYSGQEALWLVLIMILGITSIVRIPSRLRLLKAPDFPELGGKVPTKEFHWGARIICLLLGAFLAGYAHLTTSLPVGSDTLAYVYDVNSVLHNGVQWAFVYTDNPLLVWLAALVQQLSGLSTAQVMGVVGILLSICLGLAVWLYCNSLFRKSPFGNEVTTFAVFFTAVSPTILRSTIDLYASLLGQVLLLFSLYLVLSPPRSGVSFRTLAAPAAFVLLLISYWEFWILAVVLSLLSAKSNLSGIRRASWILLPSLILFTGLLVYSALFPPPAYWGIGRSILEYFSSTSIPTFTGFASSSPTLNQLSAFPQGPYLRTLFGEGNIFVGLLALVGLVFVDPRGTNVRTLYLMSFVFALGVLSVSYGTHAAVAYPSSILAAIGIVGVMHIRELTGRQPGDKLD